MQRRVYQWLWRKDLRAAGDVTGQEFLVHMASEGLSLEVKGANRGGTSETSVELDDPIRTFSVSLSSPHPQAPPCLATG